MDPNATRDDWSPFSKTTHTITTQPDKFDVLAMCFNVVVAYYVSDTDSLD